MLKHKIKDYLHQNYPKVSRRLISLYFGLKRPAASYSQKGEDLFCYYFLKNVKAGRYLDIGAYHPKFISNTHLLHKAGWTGFAVDISRYKLREMEKFRGTNVKCIQAAIVGEKTKNLEYAYLFDQPWSDLDTLSESTAQKYQENGAGSYSKVQMETKGINELFSQLPEIDFLNIDIEGLDKDLLMNLDFDKYRPRLICYEDNEEVMEECAVQRRLRNFGYRLVFSIRGSICFGLTPLK